MNRTEVKKFIGRQTEGKKRTLAASGQC